MSIPTPAELRRAVQDAGEKIPHPTKGPDHKYGRVVYFEGGHVGVKLGKYFYIAEGATHDESVWALAHKVGAVDFGPKVTVNRVSADDFRQRSIGS